MAKLTAARLAAFRDRHPPAPRVFVETGTYRGDTARLAAACFPAVHTVELSPDLYAAHAPTLEAAGIHCHAGDSRVVVPALALQVQEEVCWYLDAHWTPMREGAARGPFPLWDELAAIAARPYRDIVVVDDVHCFEGRGPEPAWKDVTLGTIAARFPGFRAAAIVDDQAVVWR